MVGQIENERNFHIFYQLTKAAPPEYRGKKDKQILGLFYLQTLHSLESYGLQGPESFLYTSRSNCLDVPGINDVQDFQETLVKQTKGGFFYSGKANLGNLECNGCYWFAKTRTR